MPAAAAAGYLLDKDWTEVVLFGQYGEHNTVESPFDKPKNKQWIGTILIQRFDSVPAEFLSIADDGRRGFPRSGGAWRRS